MPKDLLKRLKLSELSDLALLMPKKFSDYSLKPEPKLGCKQAAKIIINSIKNYQARTICECFCPHWNMIIMLAFFYPKAAVKKQLVVGKELIVFGKLVEFSSLASFSGPEIINPNELYDVNFGFKNISSDEIMSAKQAYLTPQFFAESGLPQAIYEILLKMNYIDEASSALFESDELNYALKYAEIFYHLKRLHESAASAPLRRILMLNDISSWLANLPFKPTDDQLAAINDIRSDLVRARHKERVVMGDVGCGKSLVMFASALSCFPARSVLMAPTSVLAAQLYTEAKKLLPASFNVYLLQASSKTSSAKEQVARLQEELKNAHLIISTHAALHNDLGQIALVMIDEQQRFGSKQRAKLGALKGAHYVEFSATPIPRTTAMINGGLYSYSFIKQLPFKKDIQTICLPASKGAEALRLIQSEVAKNHQAIVIYPLIEKGKSSQYLPLNDAISFYEKHFKNVYYTHGKDPDKEQKLAEFAKRGDVMLSTTVIEVGISLPRLSVMLIVAPERYGLATLHQLRGRLCRAGVPGHCYLLSKNDFAPRLEEFCQTLDGFEIAEIDLKNRKSGDISQEAAQSGEQFVHFDENTDTKIYEAAKAHLINVFGDLFL